MNTHIGVLGAVVAAVLVAGTWAARWAWRPTRSARPYGAPAPRQVIDCPDCRAKTAATVHGSLLRCDAGHQITGAV